MYKTKLAVFFAVLALTSGCATPMPALKATGIALGVALVAGAAQQHGSGSSALPDARVPGNPCAPDPARCK